MKIKGIAPPFDFAKTVHIFSKPSEWGVMDNFEDGEYWRALDIKGLIVVPFVTSCGTLRHPALEVRLVSNGHLTRRDRRKVKEKLSWILGLDVDIRGFYKAVRDDDVMAGITKKLYGVRTPSTESVYEALMYSIVEQQISIKAAASISMNMIKRFGRRDVIDGREYFTFPRPEELAMAKVDNIRSCGTSEKKAEYIRDLSAMVAKGELDLEGLKGLGCEEIVKTLVQLRGIGRWTAEYTMVRGMRKPEAFPADDLGILRDVSKYYFQGRKITPNDARRVAERWQGYAGYAAYYMLMASRLGLF